MRISKRFIKSLLTSLGWWSGVAFSFTLYFFVNAVVEERNQAEFDYHARNTQLAIQAKVHSYIEVLKGLSALFYTNDYISRTQFHNYVGKLNLSQSFPGIRSLNFARQISPAERDTFVSSVRSDTSITSKGYPEFSIKPAEEYPAYHVLTYVEPSEANPFSFGINIASREGVANALAASRDTGQLMSSGHLVKVTGSYEHLGIAMRMPVYRGGLPINTIKERRAAYYGSVGIGFDLNKLLTEAIDKDTLRYIRLKIYDTGREDDNQKANSSDTKSLIFDGGPYWADSENKTEDTAPFSYDTHFIKRISMSVGPRVWEAEFSAPKGAILKGFDAYLALAVLIGMLLLSLLLYSIYYFFTSSQKRAAELAGDMTKDLRASEASLAEAQRMAHLGSWIFEPLSGEMQWSTETYAILGFKPDEDPDYINFLCRIHPEDRQWIKDGIEKSIQSGEEFNAEHRIIKYEGSICWVQTICRVGQDNRTTVLRGTMMDITDNKDTLDELKRSQELLRELTAHKDRIKEEERKRIAREIHDELGQTLLALRIDVSMLESRTNNSHPRLNARAKEALHYIDSTVKTIRTIINNLRPAVLDLGLVPAIEWQVAEFRRRTGIACNLMIDSSTEFAVDNAISTTLFRILQESLTNVIRHANASQVSIKLYKEKDTLVIKITDNGIGIHQETLKAANAFGLVGIEERIISLNGAFSIESPPGEGTTLTILIPAAKTEKTVQETDAITQGEVSPNHQQSIDYMS